MPTYEYLCESCGHRFEKFQKVADASLQVCPECGVTVKKLISGGIGVIFNGSGFYQTYYRKSASRPTKCGRTERSNKPPCADNGECMR